MRVIHWCCAVLLTGSALAQAPFFGGMAPACAMPVEEIDYQAYAVGYSEATRTPVWSAYEVSPAPGQPHPVHRRNTFFVEYRTHSRISPRDYLHSGYSRGHMTPFAAIGHAFGEAEAEETFSMANVAPQLQNFNVGIWSRLEAELDGRGGPRQFHPGLTQKVAHIWVYTGPVFAPDQPPRRIPPKGIQVPTAFWKAAVWLTAQGETHACAWIIPHQAGLGARTVKAYATTMREVERATGVALVPGDDGGVMEREDAAELP